MNRKNILKTMAVAAIATVSMTGCNQSAPKVDAKSDAAQTNPTGLKIAYVEVDSIMSRYQFCKDYSLILQKKGQNIQNTLAAKQQQLQAAAANFQQKFQTETEKYNNALRDSIQHYLKLYNKDKNYSLILSKAGDNLLYADKAYDITNEVIAGLNKAYKPSAKMAAAVPAKK